MTIKLQRYHKETNILLAAKTMEERVELLKGFKRNLGTFGFQEFLSIIYESHYREGIFEILVTLINDEVDIDAKKSLFL